MILFSGIFLNYYTVRVALINDLFFSVSSITENAPVSEGFGRFEFPRGFGRNVDTILDHAGHDCRFGRANATPAAFERQNDR